MYAARALWSENTTDGALNDRFEIEGTSVIPIQFLDRTFHGAALQPEKRLQLAVLADAVETYARSALSAADTNRTVFVETEEWFASESAAGPFSFVAICDSLGFDPGYIRRGLRMSRLRLNGRTGRRVARRITSSRVVGPRVRRVA